MTDGTPNSCDDLPPVVVLVTGPPLAGKTSLTRHLVEGWPRPKVALVEADAAFPTVSGGDGAQIVVFHRGLLPWLQAGYDLIVDGSMPGDPDLRSRCLKVFDSYDLRLLGVTCSLEELRRREAVTARAVRGWAVRLAQSFPDELELSVAVDTSHGASQDWAKRALEGLRLPIKPIA